tara:strand:- start:242 stop:1309 length:1068 start_codon:yes stop_codon:yes gene_type:complete
MIYSLNKKSASDETVALTPNRVWKSYSEPILVEEGLKPIRFIAGTESEKRGEGVPSKEGNIYEVIYDGKIAVAKVLSGFSKAEPDNWKKIIEAKKVLPERLSRHLPEIYSIIEPNAYTTIIVMELLSKTNPHVSKILRTKDMRQTKNILKNEDFISEALKISFDSTIANIESSISHNNEKAFKMFLGESEKLKQDIEGDLLKGLLSFEKISDKIKGSLRIYTDMLSGESASIIDKISRNIQKNFISYINTSKKPVAKYYSSRDIDYTIKMLEDTDHDSLNSKRIQELEEERDLVYTSSPASFLFSEKYMPETKGLFQLLNALKNLGIEWSDVHANNIMERPGTRELVLIDVGFFT